MDTIRVFVCLLPALALGPLTACARMEAPPGGPPDNVPPVVISTTPDTFALVEPFDGNVTFEFSERISERAASGSLDEAVVVSPATGAVEVDQGRQSLEVSLEGGFRRGHVYRVRILPIVRDLFGNAMVSPYELVFSTGPEFLPGVVAGEVLDRITGDAVDGARIHALERRESGDSVLHVGRSDSDGIFTLRYLPPGSYGLVAFDDRNRDGSPDEFEPMASRDLRLVGEADTVIVSMEILAADTTAPRIVGGEAVDSTTIRLDTDDALDPAEPLEPVQVTVSREDGVAPPVDSLLHEYQWEARRSALEAAAAAAEPEDTLDVPPDNTDAEPDTAGAPPEPPDPDPPAGDTVASPYDPGEPPRAERALYVLLQGPLEPEVPYTVSVEGLRNIAETAGGQGEIEVVWEPPPPDTAAADVGDDGAGDDGGAADDGDAPDGGDGDDDADPPDDPDAPG